MERFVRVKMPEPKPFSGVRDSKEVENFLWDMEQYFSASHVPDSEKVTLTSMYLTGDAKLWWRSCLDDDTEAGRSRISTWESLKKELRDQFLPCNTAWVARDALKRLTHIGTVREYVKRFTSLMLDIKNMSEEDKLFNFLSGLQPWAQLELRRQTVKDLPSAIAAADGLVDYKLSKSSNDPSTPKQNLKGKKGRDTKNDKGKKLMYEGSRKDLDDSKSKSSGFTGCFICNGPHRTKECPKREKLNVVQLETMTSSETDSVPT